MAADTHQACWTVEAKATALRNQRKLAVHYYHNSYSTFPKIQAKSTWDDRWQEKIVLPPFQMFRLGKPILLSLMNKSSFFKQKRIKTKDGPR